jgi:hypothetical protein
VYKPGQGRREKGKKISLLEVEEHPGSLPRRCDI